ncbi:MAG TPA: type II toxin-antitoxin system HicB family antitoxin [Gammaproteobacteria bacterium]|nr:type II toxin-antitoxin system HicB family antitoxin [Gammaproteobacteria bacterium]
MRYPIAIEPGDARHAYGVVVPDLPGCFSGGDSLDEAIEGAREAILLHIEGLLESGKGLTEPRPVSEHQQNADYEGWIWALVDVDLTGLDSRAKRINITLPTRILNLVDKAARRGGESRSGFLAHAALEYMERRQER